MGFVAPDIDIRVIENRIVETPLEKYYPPDTTAAIFWLKNRQKDKWRDKVDHELTGKDGGAIGLAFWRYILTNTTVQCVTSFAARKFRHGQMYCAMIGLKRVGTIKKYFKGVDDVTFYSATREELIDFLNHGR
nr:DUF2824 family protein [Escherichia coli]